VRASAKRGAEAVMKTDSRARPGTLAIRVSREQTRESRARRGYEAITLAPSSSKEPCMSATSERPADVAAVRPFRVEIPQAEVDELRQLVRRHDTVHERALEITFLVSSFMNLRVADIHACYEQWSSKGAEFVTPPIDRGAEIRCYMRDPDGYMIEVGQATGVLHGELAKKRPEDLPG
jgi:hypothetical protein